MEFQQCPDGSCRENRDDCPKAKTCGDNLALCIDNSCREQCVTVGPIQARVLQESTELPGHCDENNKFICPGGECATNFFNCPNVETCQVGLFRCPDQSCVEDVQQCILEVCEPGLYSCWDGRCISDPQKCPTRSSCSEGYSTKCSDGTCVQNIEECHEYMPCPAHMGYRCASGECRRHQGQCPVMITCPPELPIKCQDN